ncbi:MAG: hydroxymethylbilane synthase [Bacilli bacterium]
MKKILIGSRKSNLAMTQSNIIKEKILAVSNNIEIEIIPISTKGDRRLDINWKSSNESLKGLFTSELEKALLNNEIDIAVHSLKDMPTDFNSKLIITYVDKEDERDVFVSDKYNCIDELPKNSIVGTSSIRRELQLRKLRPDLEYKIIRGNIETRINKMLGGEYDAIILAAAGLKRTNNCQYLKQFFNDDELISASGQGILCLETRKKDKYIMEILEKITDEDTVIKAEVERTFSKIFDGGCSVPMGCNAIINRDRILFRGMYFYNGVRYDGYVEGFKYEGEAVAYRLSNQIKNQYCSEKGTVYLVGAGPGNYELLTLKAHRLITQADCILYDRLVSDEILDNIKPSCKLVYVGKDNHEKGLSQKLINEQIINAAFDYKIIVRLKSGDPFIFGRGFEEILAIKKYNINYEIVPGISSFIGASAYSGIPLTDRNTSSDIHIFSGHGKNNECNLDYKQIVKLDGTLIFFMAIRNVKEIVKNLMINGKNENEQIAFVENATTSDQRVVISTFCEVLNSDVTTKIKAPAIIIVGDTVALNKKGEWFNKDRQLTLLSTRESKHFKNFEEVANNYKFSCLSAPQIEICEVSNLQDDLGYDIILFNSVNGVNHFLRLQPNFNFENKVIGAVGIKTKQVLENYGVEVLIVPKVYNMEQLLEITVNNYKNSSILIVGSKQTRLDINKWNRRVNNKLMHYVTYDTRMVECDYNSLKAQINKSNVICFFSASGIESFLENIKYKRDILHSKKIASIGEYTSKVLNDNGIDVDIKAKVSTQEGLISAIKDYYNLESEKNNV